MTATTTTMPAFGRGGDAAKEAEEALSASRGGSFRKTEYLPEIGKDKWIFLRYITDVHEWYYCNAHSSAPTKAQPPEWPSDRKFPASMPAVCRYDKAFKGDPAKGIPPIYTDCYICDAKLVNQWGRQCNPAVRVWALACIREEVLGTPEMVAKGLIPQEAVGKRVGFKDATREVKVARKDDQGNEVTGPDGKTIFDTIVEPRIVVVNKPVPNYFAGLLALSGMPDFNGTITDRDFCVVQKDEKKDVDFQHVHMDRDGLKPGTPGWQRYTDAVEAQGLNIPAMLMDRSSDEFYGTFFDPNKAMPKREARGGSNSTSAPSAGQEAPSAQQEAAPSNDVDQDRLKAMRDRVRGAGATPPQAAPEQPAAAAPTAPAGGPIDFSG